ncbi:MAG: N-acetyltransferase [Cyanobacteria bacterium J083]|nr:MAG: N-acetyltransferase [Cyanobacteria bacterium J083]
MSKEIKSQYTFQWLTRVSEIPQKQWDELASGLPTPFLEWEWLNNLETSGSAVSGTGWQPCHLILWRNRELIAAAPLYIKGHSYGEFVFDQQWADLAIHHLRVNYYPKLLGMSPFTPAVGYRFLIAAGEDEREITQMMLREIDHFCLRHQLSGCNFLFVDPQWQPLVEEAGFTAWLHHSYIWTNQDFNDFSDYLKIFNSNQRKNIKRERKAVNKFNLQLKVMTGEEIPQSLYPWIYRFYSNTCDKFYWGSKYLTKKFFAQLYPNYSHRVVLVAAYRPEDEKKPVGMSFCVRKGNNLYGRYWGSLAEYDCLHFEACYYQPIEWAISQGITMFDPGAGGRHKRRRGFPATPNYSLHRFYHPQMNQILNTYIEQINESEQAEIEAIKSMAE